MKILKVICILMILWIENAFAIPTVGDVHKTSSQIIYYYYSSQTGYICFQSYSYVYAGDNEPLSCSYVDHPQNLIENDWTEWN